jgi:hypothetical protein
VYIGKSIVRIKTYVLATYAAKIMDVTMHPCAAMIITPVLLIHVILILDVKTLRSLVMMVMNVPLIDVTVMKVANISQFLLKKMPNAKTGNPKDVHQMLIVKTEVNVLKTVVTLEYVTP